MSTQAAITGPVHFIGIGGVGQRSAAELLLAQGVEVTGSDVQDSPALVALAARGAQIFVGHAAENLGAARLVVVSSAVPEGNPEIGEARRRGVEVVKNAELERRVGLGRRTLAVAGTHGKTTTTSMLAWIFSQAGVDPTFIVGGEVRNLGVGGQAGRGPWFIVEADEYDRRFLSLDPWCAIVTSLEADHLDYYGSMEELVGAYRQFVARTPVAGRVILCADDAGARSLAAAATAPVQTYGTGVADWQAVEIEQAPEATRFVVTEHGQRRTRCTLRVPGLHNVRNALACFAAAAAAGISAEVTAAALAEFVGAGRRFELIGEAGGVTVINDYGHLPAEVRVTIASARQRYPGRRIWAVFQPHTYARTRLWMEEFAAACREADRSLVVGAYVPSGRESVQTDSETRELAARVGVPYLANRQELLPALLPQLRSSDVVLLIGAGDIYLAAEPLLQLLGAAG
ncbi:MAG TPA: UDP-N-acetylmuramate--L-alanine ligase [Chloroflexota bacterium]|jgi:UDP-N-acetylmuramate--alanine ligase|nr:UDP-N-acetylmuramate--L-alanine ligase [Chloroflexota bacterium]